VQGPVEGCKAVWATWCCAVGAVGAVPGKSVLDVEGEEHGMSSSTDEDKDSMIEAHGGAAKCKKLEKRF